MVKTKSKRKRSASSIVDYAPRGAQSHMQKALRGVMTATVQRRQTVEDFITSFVGLDVHKDSIAMAVAQAGRDEPRFLGTVSPQGAALHKALAKLGRPATLSVTVPDERDEALRDLSRARSDAVRARLKALQQLKALPGVRGLRRVQGAPAARRLAGSALGRGLRFLARHCDHGVMG